MHDFFGFPGIADKQQNAADDAKKRGKQRESLNSF
jgi:hypothetical protein